MTDVIEVVCSVKRVHPKSTNSGEWFVSAHGGLNNDFTPTSKDNLNASNE